MGRHEAANNGSSGEQEPVRQDKELERQFADYQRNFAGNVGRAAIEADGQVTVIASGQ